MAAIDRLLLPPDLIQFLDLWEAKCRGRAMPARADFTVEELQPWLSRLHLVRVEGDDGRYVVFATASAERYGREMTGKLISQFTPIEMAERALADHHALLQGREPTFAVVNDTFGPVLMHWCRLAVPLSDDGITIDRYMVALHYYF